MLQSSKWFTETEKLFLFYPSEKRNPLPLTREIELFASGIIYNGKRFCLWSLS